MPSKSQTELEQPAKVYQLDAVEQKVDQVLLEVGKISQNTAGVVTNIQLESRLEKLEKDIHDAVDAKYGPIKSGAWYVVGAVLLGVGMQVILNLLNLGGK